MFRRRKWRRWRDEVVVATGGGRGKNRVVELCGTEWGEEFNPNP